MTAETMTLEPLERIPVESPVRCCRRGPDDALTFDVSAEQLFAAWLRTVESQPRTERLGLDASGFLALHIQRTRFLRFTDEVRAQVLPLPDGRAALVVDSRSRYAPIWDFGVNRRRVDRWCAALRRGL